MAHNLFFIDTRTSWISQDITVSGWELGPSDFKVRLDEVAVLASHNGRDLIHYVTNNKNHARLGRSFDEFIGDSYIEIVLGSLLGILPTIIAKKILWLRYELAGISKIASVEVWEADGSPPFDKVLKPHRFLGVDVD